MNRQTLWFGVWFCVGLAVVFLVWNLRNSAFYILHVVHPLPKLLTADESSIVPPAIAKAHPNFVAIEQVAVAFEVTRKPDNLFNRNAISTVN